MATQHHGRARWKNRIQMLLYNQPHIYVTVPANTHGLVYTECTPFPNQTEQQN